MVHQLDGLLLTTIHGIHGSFPQLPWLILHWSHAPDLEKVRLDENWNNGAGFEG